MYVSQIKYSHYNFKIDMKGNSFMSLSREPLWLSTNKTVSSHINLIHD